MAEYIEKHKAVNLLTYLENEFQQFKPFKGFEHAMYRKLCETEIAIGKLPAADVVPVVRCKDCKWFADNNGGQWYGCQMFQVVRITPEDAPKPDDFCSYGERKDGGADNG
jgi:hypothetical protein